MGLPLFTRDRLSAGCSAGFSTCAVARPVSEKKHNAIGSLMFSDCIAFAKYENLLFGCSPVTHLGKASSFCQIPVTISGRTHPFHPIAPALYFSWGGPLGPHG